ncbi:MAG TPA: Spy/CpxP family protein refolding chaperone [Candidatus Angelobacter sp.]|nr:Spy/CpxP family protein refolding chaperone [Candidatus Angelobacter sp.]
MMKKKFFLGATAIILVVAAGLAGTMMAQGPGQEFGPGFRRHSGWMLKHMTKELNLTTDQQSQIKSIMQAERTKTRPLMQQLRQNAQAQNATINGNFDEQQARTFAGKQSQIMSDLIVERQRTKSQIYAVLTPEQRQKAQQLMQQRQQKRQQWKQRHSQQQQQQQPQSQQ